MLLLVFALSGCGGGGSNGGGGGGGGNGVTISRITPSQVMVGIPVALVEVYGQGFTRSSKVLVNGVPVNTLFTQPGSLEAEIDFTLNFTPGVYQFSVQSGSSTSSSVPYTVYAPQQGPFVMRAVPGFLVSDQAQDAPFIVAADVNSDGLADVIMPVPGGSIAILNGEASGLLSAPQYISVPSTPYALAVGDVDGNGTPDLVSITSNNASSTTVSIMLGDGHGNFQQPSAQQTFPGLFPGPAYLADLDGDGKLDLVLSVEPVTGLKNNILWLKNTGGGFAAPVTLATTVESSTFAVADFNRDGRPDIMYALYSATSPSLHILMNQGNGNFSDQVAGGIDAVGNMTVLDFNLDGIPDVVVQVLQPNGGTLYSFAGNGNGSFTQVTTVTNPGTVQLVTGDFDHDGFPDLAGPSGTEPSEILYFFGDGHGHFTLQPVVGPEGQYAAVGDFNGDGIPDVVVPDRFNFVSLALGRTDRNFPSALSLTPAFAGGLSTGDVNGDGLPEIFASGLVDPIDNFFLPGTVFQNLGNSSFQFAASTDPYSFEVADMTGKEVVDLLGGGKNLTIWPNNGTFDFSAPPITVPQTGLYISVADMDRDGHPDFVSWCEDEQCAGQVFYGEGNYQFTPITVPNLQAPYVVGDFNGDGMPDIAAGGHTFLNTGNRNFQDVNNGLPLTGGALVTVGDFNGDGKDDIAISLPGDTLIGIYYSNGDGTFYYGTAVDPGQYPGALVAGDFNGDGRIDIAVGLSLSQQACLLFNQGNGQFTRSFFASGASAVAITAADLNRNGKLDLAIGNFFYSFMPANVDVVFHQ